MSTIDKELKKIARSLRKPISESDRMMNQALAKQAKELLNKKAQEHTATTAKINRQDLIDLLITTRTQSEGVTADLIIEMVGAKPAVNQQQHFAPKYFEFGCLDKGHRNHFEHTGESCTCPKYAREGIVQVNKQLLDGRKWDELVIEAATYANLFLEISEADAIEFGRKLRELIAVAQEQK